MVDNGNNQRRLPELQRLSRRTVLKSAAAAAAVGTLGSGTAAATEEEVSDDFGTGRELDDSIDGPAYGGGEEYVEDNADAGFTLDDADYVVTSASDFHDLFESKETGDNTTCSPQSGDVVYVPGNCKIELTMSDHRFIIPPGVTLASDRGVDGRPGGMIYTNDYRTNEWPYDPWLFHPQSNARVSGLRIRGRYWDWGPFSSSDAHSEYCTGYGVKIEAANGTDPTGVEVDNSQIYGWAVGSVSTHDGADDIRVHHNDLHDNLRRGLGYGFVSYSSGYTEVEYNSFNRNRHAIASGGGSGNQYEAHHNVVGYYQIGHALDVHDPGGYRYDVYNNTVRTIYDNDGSTMTSSYVHRGTPDDAANIYENWFYNHRPPQDDPDTDDDEEDRAIAQIHNETSDTWYHYDSWENLYYWDNHYGHDSDPPSGVGAPASERVIYH